jgi:DNA helicase-2/ATP-dependent DNA helicase PcrA
VDWRRTAGAMTSWNRPQYSMPTSGGRAPQNRFGTASARSDAAKKAKAGRPIPSLDPGDRVQHDTFGLGTVVALEGVGDSSVASIDFGADGVKRLLLRYAPVEKL